METFTFIQKNLPDAPPASSLMHDLGGYLINANEVFEYPFLLPSNYLLVGGMNIVAKEEEVKNFKFTGELGKFINSAEDGLFVLSFGNNRDRMYEPEFLQTVMDAFKMFPRYR